MICDLLFLCLISFLILFLIGTSGNQISCHLSLTFFSLNFFFLTFGLCMVSFLDFNDFSVLSYLLLQFCNLVTCHFFDFLLALGSYFFMFESLLFRNELKASAKRVKSSGQVSGHSLYKKNLLVQQLSSVRQV